MDRLHAKAADPPSSSAAPGKEEEEQKSSDNKKRRRSRRSGGGGGGGKKAVVKQVVEAWAQDSLDLRRFQGKRVGACIRVPCLVDSLCSTQECLFYSVRCCRRQQPQQQHFTLSRS